MRWKAGSFKKFVDEAKKRNLSCGVMDLKAKAERNQQEAKEKAHLAAEAEAKAEAQRKAEEEARLTAEAEAKRKAEEEARLTAEAEAKRKAEEEARLVVEAKRKAEEEARLAAEAENKVNSKNASNQTTTNTYKKARANCEAKLTSCNEAVLCKLATFGPTNMKNWKVGGYAKFVNEAKRRGIGCSVDEEAKRKEADKLETCNLIVEVAYKRGLISKSAAESNIDMCMYPTIILESGEVLLHNARQNYLSVRTETFASYSICLDLELNRKFRSTSEWCN